MTALLCADKDMWREEACVGSTSQCACGASLACSVAPAFNCEQECREEQLCLNVAPI